MPVMELAPYGSGRVHPVLPEGTGDLPYTAPAVEPLRGERPLGDLWDCHGGSVYAVACTLLGDEEAAIQAVTLGMADLASSSDRVSAQDARRSMARHVFWRSQELTGKTPRSMDLPPAMVWLGHVAQLQRACLALCVFGGHTYREAAGLLGVPPTTVAELLTAGVREVGQLATGRASTSASAL